MNLIWCPNAETGRVTELEENEFHHIRVLRMNVGEKLHLFDGRGRLFNGRLLSVSKKTAAAQVDELIRQEREASAKLHLVIAPTKNTERMDWFAEKATEIGVHTITPVICRHSERRDLRIDRLEKVVLSAAKQSMRLWLPVVRPVVDLPFFLEGAEIEKSGKFIGYCREKEKLLKDALEKGSSATILIGPEGDFSEEEVQKARKSGFLKVSLGETRLRTETAGIMAAAIFNIVNSL